MISRWELSSLQKFLNKLSSPVAENERKLLCPLGHSSSRLGDGGVSILLRTASRRTRLLVAQGSRSVHSTYGSSSHVASQTPARRTDSERAPYVNSNSAGQVRPARSTPGPEKSDGTCVTHVAESRMYSSVLSLLQVHLYVRVLP